MHFLPFSIKYDLYGSLFPIIYIITVWFQFLHRINAAFGVSSKFVPYRPNYDLVANAITPSIVTVSPFDTNITIIGSLSWKCNNLAWINVRVKSTQAINANNTANVILLDNASLVPANTLTVGFPIINGDLGICGFGWLFAGSPTVGIKASVNIPANTELMFNVCYRCV